MAAPLAAPLAFLPFLACATAAAGAAASAAAASAATTEGLDGESERRRFFGPPPVCSYITSTVMPPKPQTHAGDGISGSLPPSSVRARNFEL